MRGRRRKRRGDKGSMPPTERGGGGVRQEEARALAACAQSSQTATRWGLNDALAGPRNVLWRPAPIVRTARTHGLCAPPPASPWALAKATLSGIDRHRRPRASTDTLQPGTTGRGALRRGRRGDEGRSTASASKSCRRRGPSSNALLCTDTKQDMPLVAPTTSERGRAARCQHSRRSEREARAGHRSGSPAPLSAVPPSK